MLIHDHNKPPKRPQTDSDTYVGSLDMGDGTMSPYTAEEFHDAYVAIGGRTADIRGIDDPFDPDAEKARDHLRDQRAQKAGSNAAADILSSYIDTAFQSPFKR